MHHAKPCRAPARQVAVLAALFAAQLTLADSPAPRQARPSAEQAWQRLKEGNARFVADRPLPRKFAERRAEVAGGQEPFAAVLACADSRTGPEHVFD
jgi:carbonic anhydrase